MSILLNYCDKRYSALSSSLRINRAGLDRLDDLYIRRSESIASRRNTRFQGIVCFSRSIRTELVNATDFSSTPNEKRDRT